MEYISKIYDKHTNALKILIMYQNNKITNEKAINTFNKFGYENPSLYYRLLTHETKIYIKNYIKTKHSHFYKTFFITNVFSIKKTFYAYCMLKYYKNIDYLKNILLLNVDNKYEKFTEIYDTLQKIKNKKIKFKSLLQKIKNLIKTDINISSLNETELNNYIYRYYFSYFLDYIEYKIYLCRFLKELILEYNENKKITKSELLKKYINKETKQNNLTKIITKQKLNETETNMIDRASSDQILYLIDHSSVNFQVPDVLKHPLLLFLQDKYLKLEEVIEYYNINCKARDKYKPPPKTYDEYIDRIRLLKCFPLKTIVKKLIKKYKNVNIPYSTYTDTTTVFWKGLMFYHIIPYMYIIEKFKKDANSRSGLIANIEYKNIYSNSYSVCCFYDNITNIHQYNSCRDSNNAMIEKFKKNIDIKKCKFIVVPIVLKSEMIKHANVFFINTQTKTLEIFEPNDIFIEDMRLEELRKEAIEYIKTKFPEYIKKESFPRLRCIKSNEYCSFHELQLQQVSKSYEYGFCVLWCLYITEIRLSNPKMDFTKLITIMFKYIQSLPNINEYMASIGILYQSISNDVVDNNYDINIVKKFAKVWH